MGRWKTEEEVEMDPKAQLVREICSLSSAFASCTHRRRRVGPRNPCTFIDWYLVLRIDDNAGVDLVRRRYRHLALQLHPDKNKHPQAEIAFKLVSEAYACLSDETRRRAFDSERLASACQECSRRLHRDRREAPRRNAEEEAAAKAHTVRSQRILRALEEVRSRIREDAKVIENCLRARQAYRRQSSSSPIFDPSDCLLYPDYPHHSLRVPEEIWYIHATGHAPRTHKSSRPRGRCESPVYEIGAESASSRYSKFRFS